MQTLIPRKTKTERQVAELMNNATFVDYLNKLKMIATSLFTWENLDKLCGFGASRFMELSLYEFGKASVITDPELGNLVTHVNTAGKVNTYDLPTRVQCYSVTYNKQYNMSDIIYVQNNITETPTIFAMQLVAMRLYEIQRAIDTNVKAQKTPVLIETSTKDQLTMKNVYSQYDGNVPFIFGRKSTDLKGAINVLKTDAPYVADKLTLLKHDLLNEAMTSLGINNANQDKKERLVESEVSANDEMVAYFFNCFYKTRQDAVNRINEKYKLEGDNKIKLVTSKQAMEFLGILDNDNKESEAENE